MGYEWKSKYDTLVDSFIKQHFGSTGGVSELFPYMKSHFRWKQKDQFVLDARTVLKNNNEYHGIERHAHQYHVAGMYDYAYQHWLIAASWRRENMLANNFDDEQHVKAVEFDLKNVEYNMALHKWQKKRGRGRMPVPEDFGLDPEIISRKDAVAEAQIERVYAKKPSA